MFESVQYSKNRFRRLVRVPFALTLAQVSSTFQKLFPESFDRAIPVIRHRKVDMLLVELDKAMWQYEQVQTSARKIKLHSIILGP